MLTGQQCHNNAVFDLEWMPGEMKFVSASGKIWIFGLLAIIAAVMAVILCRMSV